MWELSEMYLEKHAKYKPKPKQKHFRYVLFFFGGGVLGVENATEGAMYSPQNMKT